MFVVVLGSLLILQAVVLRVLEWTKLRNRGGTRDPLYVVWAWFPLLLGSSMLLSNLPRLVGAPHGVVEICDPLGGLLALIDAVWAFRVAQHARARKARSHAEAQRG